MYASTGGLHQLQREVICMNDEKGVGQRTAAADMGISQALLSHYENGIREPGLPFLLRACDYYGVSADFLLGRTLERNGTVIAAEDLYDVSADREQPGSRGGVLAMLHRKLILNSVGLLFDLLAATENPDVIRAASAYLSDAVYKIFRRLYQSNPKNDLRFFSVSRARFAAGLADADMNCCEVELEEALSRHAEDHGALPDMSDEALTKNFPDLAPSLLKVLHSSGERINRLAKRTPDGDS